MISSYLQSKSKHWNIHENNGMIPVCVYMDLGFRKLGKINTYSSSCKTSTG